MTEAIALIARASDAGHALAKVKLAYAYMGAVKAPIDLDTTRAQQLFREAIESTNEPDGHYGLAVLYLVTARRNVMGQKDNAGRRAASIMALEGPSYLHQAIYHLEEAARGGHVMAMFNLGVCHNYGYCASSSASSESTGGSGSGNTNLTLAADWYEASGMPEGYAAKAMLLLRRNQTEEARGYQETATKLGHGAPWRKRMREGTGHMGISGVALNLLWPPLPNGGVPPEW